MVVEIFYRQVGVDRSADIGTDKILKRTNGIIDRSISRVTSQTHRQIES